MTDTSFVTGGNGEVETLATPTASSVDLPPAEAAFVKQWQDRVRKGRKHHEKAFDRMRECQHIARYGGGENWTKSTSNFVLPVLTRHINQAVAQLYAKNPKAEAKRRPRLMSALWDGTLASLQEAANTLQQTAQTGAPDQTALQIVQGAEDIKKYNATVNGVCKTLTYLLNHHINDPVTQVKQELKAVVRRTKVCAVGYVKLSFQRILEKNPEITARIDSVTGQIARAQLILDKIQQGDMSEEAPDMFQLKTLLKDLETQEEIVVSERPVWSYPASRALIIDPACTHLKTLLGAGWVAEEYEKCPDDIQEEYGVDVKKEFTEWRQRANDDGAPSKAKVWEVWNRRTGQTFTICDGYAGFLKPPAEPDVRISRFFPYFPLVFNESEFDGHEDSLFPLSDVWLAKDIQDEFNRAEQGLREHRRQNLPAYVAPLGALEEKDLQRFQNYVSGEIIQLSQMGVNEKVSDKLQAKPTINIDMKVYDTNILYDALLRVVGAQSANLGQPGHETATESSIAENSRTAALADNVDDLDDMLSALVHATGEVMLRNMSKQTVVEIVGPGAVWPDLPRVKEEMAEAIILDIKAGSSGRPNQALELSKLERGMPFLLQMPGVNPIPIGQRYVDLLDIDAEDAIIEGIPSITAINGALVRAQTGGPQQPSGPGGAPPSPNIPAAQGIYGGDNAEAAPRAGATPAAGLPAPAP